MTTEAWLIDANKLKAISFKEYMSGEDCVFLSDIDESFTVDAATVVHGRWMPCGFGKEIMCSVCGCELNDIWQYRYCPDCGAKMDLEESSNDD